MTSLNFHEFGVLPAFRDRLKIRLNDLIKKGYMLLMNFGRKPSGPRALLLFIYLTALRISQSSIEMSQMVSLCNSTFPALVPPADNQHDNLSQAM